MATQVPPIGTTILKDFSGHGTFWGQVVFYTFNGRYVRVAYTDDDKEDLNPSTVWKLARPAPGPLSIRRHLMVPNEEDMKNGATFHPVFIPGTTAEASPTEESTAEESGDDDEVDHDGRRRSKRTKTSTVVYVGKDAVKRDNNYVVNGVTYQYGVVDGSSGPMSGPPRRVKYRSPPVQRKGSPKKPRVVSPEEMARLAMKQRLEGNIRAKQTARQAFLCKHRAALEPFCPSLPHAAPPLDKIPLVEEEVMQPDAIQADLRDYQLAGLNFMSSMYQQNMSMILGDEMGLGKTLQTLSLICLLKEKWNQTGPNLVVCPMSVLYSWCNEVEKWAPSLKYLRFHSSQTESIASQSLADYDIVVTTYEMMAAKDLQRLWSREHFNLCILDEGHKIKNHATNQSQAACRLHAECRIILTGTPLANNLTELWSLLKFLEPTVFSTSQPFDDAFDLVTNRIDNTKLNQAHALLKVMMLRRLKSQVEQKLPPKIETKVICPLSTTQVWWYKALLVKDLSVLVNGGSGAKASVLSNLVMQLRKCCLHPFLFSGVEEDPNTTSLTDLIGQSGKLAVLDLLLMSLFKKGHRVTLFSQFTKVLDILDDYCRLRGWKYCRFDGGTLRARRNHIINSFNAEDSDKFIFLMSTRSGGMGINLQTADTCILFDSDWNPQPDIQAIGRTHRLGQTKTVHIYRLATSGTVEERMLQRAEKKLYLDRMVTRDDAVVMNAGEEDKSDKLLSTLRFGCNAVFGSAMKVQELPSLQDIELITDRARTDDWSKGKLRGSAQMSADAFDTTKELSSTTDFGGIDFKALREKYKKKRPKDMGAIQDMWKRVRKNRIKMFDGTGSGYGLKAVPVLASNDYDLATGEKSVFDRELKGRHQQHKKKSAKIFEHQDFCQSCGDGGSLICCPRCPVSLHFHCAGIRKAQELACCSHHHCTLCNKSASAAGGLLYPCMACSNCYCEDDLPQKAIMLDDGCARMEKLGYYIKNGVYVICPEQCRNVAETEFSWKQPTREDTPCPDPIDFSSFFGTEVDDIMVQPESSQLMIEGKRKRRSVDYAVSERRSPLTTASSASAASFRGHPQIPAQNKFAKTSSPYFPTAYTGPAAVSSTGATAAPRYPHPAAYRSASGPTSSIASRLQGGQGLKAPPVRSESSKENSGDIIDLTHL